MSMLPLVSVRVYDADDQAVSEPSIRSAAHLAAPVVRLTQFTSDQRLLRHARRFGAPIAESAQP